MKKIIAVILALCCIFTVVSCDQGTMDEVTSAQLDAMLEMFDDSIPTKSETYTTETIGKNVVIKSRATLVSGHIGSLKASVYEGSYQSLSEVGNTLSMVKTETESKWYVEGKGVSTDKGVTFNAEEGDFAPTEGFIKIKISKNMVSEAEYDEQTSTLKLTIPKKHATEVVGAYLEKGQTIDSDIIVTLTCAGGRITGLKLEYSIPTHMITVPESETEIQVPDTTVVVEAIYSYGLQSITLKN